MLKRAKRLAEQQQRAASEQPHVKPASSKDFSLKSSPLTRVLAWGVGRGQPASGMQRVAAAAVRESGVQNVHKRASLAYDSKRHRGFLGAVLGLNGTPRHCMGLQYGIQWKTRISY